MKQAKKYRKPHNKRMYPPECTDGLWGDKLSERLQENLRTFILTRLGAGNLRVYGMIRRNRGDPDCECMSHETNDRALSHLTNANAKLLLFH